MSLFAARLLLLLPIATAWLVPAAVCQPSDTSYHLAWSEEFDYAAGTQPSASLWNWEAGGGGWGNSELQIYTARPINSYVNNTALVVQANYESYYGSPYTSARLNTRGKVEVYLGYVAARVRVESMANGYWPAVWMMGAASESLGWPYCGEIDFMEQVNGQTAPPNSDGHTQYGTLHYNVDGINGAYPAYTATQQGGTINTTSPTVLWGDDWHVYAFEWTSTAITFTVDNTTYATVCTVCETGTNAFHNVSNPFYFVVDLAMGGSFPNEVPSEASLPGRLWVDWIRVWQKDDGVSFVNAPDVSSSSGSAAMPASLYSSSSFRHSSSSSSSLPTRTHSSSSAVSSVPSSSSTTSSTHRLSTSSSSSSSASSVSSDDSYTLDDWSPSNPAYSLVWHEEFSYTDNTQPSATLWNWETGGGGWGNNELEYYTARTVNSYVSDGTLIVAGLWESYGGQTITSARLNTNGKVAVYQGVVAARVRVRGMANGYWPAVWMMGNKSNTLNWPYCGEIDFMEQVNGMSAPTAPSDDHYQHGTLHYNLGGEAAYPNLNHAQQSNYIVTPNASVLWGDDWHVYAFEWTDTLITFIVDETVYTSFYITGNDFDSFRDSNNPFYFLIDFAFGGDFPSVSPVQSAFPARMEVDWLRVWQLPGGVSYVVAPTSSLVVGGSSSSSSGSVYVASTAALVASSTAFSSGVSSDFPLPTSASSSGSGVVHTSGARLRAECSGCPLTVVVILLLVSIVLAL